MNSAEAIKRSFPPAADARTRVLILGSLPGEASLAAAQYYAHPQNQFWRLAGEVVRADLRALSYPERLAALLAAGVGLWDVIESGRRRGSLDTAIRDPSANPLAEFADTLPALRAVAFNGGKAAALGRKLLEGRPGLALIALPSSSPAYTAPFATKAAQWIQLQRLLGSG
ncbi:MAG: DNA-deoxyinosine glycosylase [Caulobacterales bacterium 32-69-10]|nr:MAG: DNA-deoxyinosine glycosylase [Caulobacterales bacterium 32-69-10]